MAQPSELPSWATSGTTVTPSGAKQAQGWVTGEKVPAQWLNWWQNRVGQWLSYLKNLTSEALTWTAAQVFNAGLTSTTINTSGNVSVGGTLGASGNTTLGGALSVTGSSTLTGPLTANGASRVNAKLGIQTAPVYPLDVASTDAFGNIHARIGSSGLPLFLLADGGFNYVGLGFNAYYNAADLRSVAGYSSDFAQAHTDGSIKLRVGGTGAAGSAITWTEKLVIPQTTAATASAPAVALSLPAGYLSLDGAASPNSNAVCKNMLTPANLPKAMAVIKTTGSGGANVLWGFGINSLSIVGTDVQITFAVPFNPAPAVAGDPTYIVGGWTHVQAQYVHPLPANYTATTCVVRVHSTTTPGTVNLSNTQTVFFVVAFGGQ